MEGATSHVGFSRMEYIVFDRAQILPCYVIHLDWDKDHEDYFKNLPQNPRAWVAQRKNLTHPKLFTKTLGPGDKQRLKEAKIAKAAKYLGYGFGPASGFKLMIEEIAEVSEMKKIVVITRGTGLTRLSMGRRAKVSGIGSTSGKMKDSIVGRMSRATTILKLGRQRVI